MSDLAVTLDTFLHTFRYSLCHSKDLCTSNWLKCSTPTGCNWAQRPGRPKDKPYYEEKKPPKKWEVNQALSTRALSMSFVTSFPARLSCGSTFISAFSLLPMCLQKTFLPFVSPTISNSLWALFFLTLSLHSWAMSVYSSWVPGCFFHPLHTSLFTFELRWEFPVHQWEFSAMLASLLPIRMAVPVHWKGGPWGPTTCPGPLCPARQSSVGSHTAHS